MLMARRFGYILCAQWGSGILVTLFLIVLARTGPDVLGQIAVAQAFGALVAMATSAGFTDFLVARLSARSSRPRRVLAEVFLLQAILFALSMLCLGLAAGVLGHSAQKCLVLLLVSAGMGLSAMAESFFVLCRTRGRQDVEMRIRIPASLLGSAHGLICVFLGLPLPILALFKLVEAAGQGLLIGRALAWHLPWPRLARTWISGWTHSLTFAGMAICAILYNRCNIYVLDAVSGETAVGWYNVSWEIVDGICALVSSALLGKVVFPLLARQWATDQRAFGRISLAMGRFLLGMSLLPMYVLLMEGDRIVLLIFGSQYQPSVPILHALLPAIPAAFLHNLAAYMMISMGRVRELLAVYVTGLAVSVLLCFALIPSGGALGAGWAISGTRLWMAMGTVGFTTLTVTCLNRTHLLSSVAAALAAWTSHWLLFPHLPREFAELAGLVPLLLLAGSGLVPLYRSRQI